MATSKSMAKKKRPKSRRPMSKRTVIKMSSILMTIVSQIKKKRKAIMSMRTSPTTMTKRMMSPMSKAMTKTRTKTAAEMTLKSKNHLAKSVSTSCATLKKYTKNCVPKSKVPSTASSAAHATTTTATTISASFVNKSTQVQGTLTMTINGSGVMNAIAG
jgi:hypothetical protein